MANANWASLALRRGGDVAGALAVAEAALDWWRSGAARRANPSLGARLGLA